MKKIKSLALLTATAFLLTPIFGVSASQAKATTTVSGDSLTVSKTASNYTTSRNTSYADIMQNEHFSRNTIGYYINPGLATGVKKDIRAAALQWNMNTNVNLYETTKLNQASINFTNDGTSNTQNGLTRNTVAKNAGGFTEVVSTKIYLSRYNFGQNTLTVTGRRIVEHELGHALGLKDSFADSTGTIMWYKTPNTDITAKDIKAINTYYK
ncbi:matrixin family metalloprotease [Companilactobacillus mishanensis]|uniref:Matrixin family metalloprotease n=1 Tax=Companilactobacillus mishanensis TaxID=2486008 RepID=A0ABW9P9L7_9LACO|nr:matrixin family metalloprotease [Companilactobacillus mishanensis]MQS45822.1 matrixin family metalloprotease [Companilactobacillus mishanensis]